MLSQKNVRPMYIVLVNYGLGKARLEQAPFFGPLDNGWQMISPRPVNKELADATMMSLASILCPELATGAALSAMA